MVTKQDIINRIAEKTGFTKKSIKMMLWAFSDVIVDVLAEGKTIFFKEIFTIRPVSVRPMDKYNPHYQKTMHYEEHNRVKITPGKRLKECVNFKRNNEDK